MSELSEQIKSLIDQAQEENRPPGKTDIEISQTVIPKTPGFSAMKEHYDEGVAAIVRRVYRQFSGAAEFENPSNAYDRTMVDITQLAQPLLFSVFADGIQMGQGTSYTYKKYRMFKRLGEVFEVDKWREESAIIALRYEMDEDSVKFLHRVMTMTCLHLGSAAGYATGMHKVEKIWDMWNMSLQSNVMTLYYCGYQLGKKWTQESELQGILAATEQQDDSPEEQAS